jgi:ACS family allantoate permease-like MFS transporter
METSSDVVSSPTENHESEIKVEKPAITPVMPDIETGDMADLKGADVKGVDKAYAYASVETIEIDEKTNRYLLRKIDTHILPWLLGLYILQYLDKGM